MEVCNYVKVIYKFIIWNVLPGGRRRVKMEQFGLIQDWAADLVRLNLSKECRT